MDEEEEDEEGKEEGEKRVDDVTTYTTYPVPLPLLSYPPSWGSFLIRRPPAYNSDSTVLYRVTQFNDIHLFLLRTNRPSWALVKLDGQRGSYYQRRGSNTYLRSSKLTMCQYRIVYQSVAGACRLFGHLSRRTCYTPFDLYPLASMIQHLYMLMFRLTRSLFSSLSQFGGICTMTS